jgi:electron transfer flavoprotein-quinone oxidoreductase
VEKVSEKLDAIVVGAGPAGSSAAYAMAKSGLQVLLVERGKKPGDKNVSGGVLFGNVLHKLIPNFWEEAPIERIIKEHRITMLSNGSATTISYSNEDYTTPPYNGFSIIRSKFDQWFAKRAEEAGAILASGIRADSLIRNGKQIVGISAGEEDVYADVIIAADGVNSSLVDKANLRKQTNPDEIALGVKEVISLDKGEIDERFNVSGNEGIAHAFVGCTQGHPGGGFIYTNEESVSLGVVVHLSALKHAELISHELVDHFKDYSIVKNLIRDGKLLEYSAHLVPEGGYQGLSNLYTDGLMVVGDAAGFVLNLGYSFEGMNYAIASGLAAARTAVHAHKHDDFSAKSLRFYKRMLNKYHVLDDFKSFKHMPGLIRNPRLHSDYPAFINGLVGQLFKSNGVPRRKLVPLTMNQMFSQLSLPHLIMDAMQVVRAI